MVCHLFWCKVVISNGNDTSRAQKLPQIEVVPAGRPPGRSL